MRIQRGKTLRRISFVAFFLAFAGLMVLPHSVQAQQPTQPPERASFENLIDALNNLETELQTLESTDVQDIHMASVEGIRQTIDEDQVRTLDRAILDANTDALHDALGEIENVSVALDEASRGDVNVTDVVAVDVFEEGEVVLYYEPSR